MASEANNNNTSELKMAEKEEESKLKMKYPSIQRPGPQFLQKRLQKGQKFFDSGDYNMAKAAAANKGSNKPRLPESKLNQGHPLPPTSVQSTQAPPPLTLPPPSSTTGDAIPTPDCLATRKASIHVPSKLVSGGP